MEEEEGRDLTGLRRTVLLGVWLCFVAYAFGPWSPGASGDPKDIELVTHLCEKTSYTSWIVYRRFLFFGLAKLGPADTNPITNTKNSIIQPKERP